MLSVTVERLIGFGIETVVVVHPTLRKPRRTCLAVLSSTHAQTMGGQEASTWLGRPHPPLTDVLVCPVDRPGWDEAVLERLLATPGEAVVPVHDGRAGHPLLVRGQVLSRLAALDVDAPLRQALDERTKVEADAPYLHVNLDRPDDLAVMPELAAPGRGENP